MKKCLPIIFAALITASVLTGCASQMKNASSEQNHVDGQSNEPVVKQASAPANEVSSPDVSPSAAAAYKKLMSFKTGDYGQQSVADFNASLAPTPDELTAFLDAQAEVISAIAPDDENYDFFTTTMSFSAHELYCEHMGEGCSVFLSIAKESRPSEWPDEDGEIWYEFTCFADLQADYSISDQKKVTVAERDRILLTFREEMQNYLSSLSEAEITDGNIRTMLTDKSAELADRLSTENMKLSPCEISTFLVDGAETDVPEQPFSEEEYQKLSALQLDGYEHMTIAEYRSRVARLTDSAEYIDLLSRLTESQRLYERKDSDETAAFLFYVLPLAGDEWKTRSYSGETASSYAGNNARLEYTFSLTVLDADAVMIKDYNDMRQGVIDAMQDILKNKTKEELRDEAAMQADIQAYVDDALSYMQTPQMRVAIEFAYFPLEAEEGLTDTEGNDSTERETRRYANGTEADYRSLLALKTSDYQNMPLADFNDALLVWANEDRERMERIDEDTKWNAFAVPLFADELSFVKETVFLSGMENGKAIQSIYTGVEPNDPYYGEDLPEKISGGGRGVTRCSLYYQFSYHISEPETVTVGERDRQIIGMIDAVKKFWSDTDARQALEMSKDDVVKKLEKIAAAYSNDHVTITVNTEKIHWEKII